MTVVGLSAFDGGIDEFLIDLTNDVAHGSLVVDVHALVQVTAAQLVGAKRDVLSAAKLLDRLLHPAQGGIVDPERLGRPRRVDRLLSGFDLVDLKLKSPALLNETFQLSASAGHGLFLHFERSLAFRQRPFHLPIVIKTSAKVFLDFVGRIVDPAGSQNVARSQTTPKSDHLGLFLIQIRPKIGQFLAQILHVFLGSSEVFDIGPNRRFQIGQFLTSPIDLEMDRYRFPRSVADFMKGRFHVARRSGSEDQAQRQGAKPDPHQSFLQHFARHGLFSPFGLLPSPVKMFPVTSPADSDNCKDDRLASSISRRRGRFHRLRFGPTASFRLFEARRRLLSVGAASEAFLGGATDSTDSPGYSLDKIVTFWYKQKKNSFRVDARLNYREERDEQTFLGRFFQILRDDGRSDSMASNLRDDLASLRIERIERVKPRADLVDPARRSRAIRRSEGGWRVFSLLLWLAPLGALGGAGAIAYRQFDALKPKTEVSAIRVQLLTTGEKEKILSAKGYVKARRIALIGAKGVGRIAEIRFEEGQLVKRGDVLAVLDHDELDAQLESRKATAERTQSEWHEAEAELAEKDAKLKRSARLFGQKQVSIDEYESALTTFRKAKARAQALRSAMKLSLAMVREVEEAIKDSIIVAPFEGTILTKEAEIGDTINPGPSSTTGRGSIATLADLTRLDVETDVAESLLDRVREGQYAEIKVAASPNRGYRGRVRKILPLGDRARETVKVKVAIEDPGDRIFPELVADVNFLPDKSAARDDLGQSFLYVPRSAVVAEAGGAFVWVVDAKFRIRKRAIKISGDSRDESARVHSGLKSGEIVVNNPSPTLRQGESVKIAD